MNEQNHGSSMAPTKRKRGQPRKEERATSQQQMFVPSCSVDAMNLIQEMVKTEGCDNAKAGTMVNGVITGTFGDGYLVTVQIPGTDTPLSGCVFIPEQFAPTTEENDVAPQMNMIKQEDIPSLVPRQSTKQFVKSESFTFEDQVLPTGLLSGISASFGNQCASGIPMANLPINKAISIKNIDKEVTTGQQAVIKNPKVELMESESMPSEQISKSVNDSVEKQACPDIVHEIQTAGGPSADVFNGGSIHAHRLMTPASGGSNFLEKNDGSVASVTDVNANQPKESFVESV